MARTGPRYPIFLAIDVEPNGFQLGDEGSGAWSGFTAMAAFVDELRDQLLAVSGAAPTVGWYYRLDPQIAAAFGRPDYAVRMFASLVAAQRDRGDYFGIHVHPVRRDPGSGTWVHDFADPEWTTECLRHSAAVFADTFGSPPRRHRFGAGFLSDAVVDECERVGIDVDLSLEPAAWPPDDRIRSGSDDTRIVGALGDYSDTPRFAYHPDVHDFRVPAPRDGRPIALIPLSTTSHLPGDAPWWKRSAKRVLLGRAPATMLYPSVALESSDVFWGLALRELETMERPYLSFALRTDDPGSDKGRNVRRLFAALPHHPIARQLRFVDPLDVVDTLLPRR
jgi:hypothetical protein